MGMVSAGKLEILSFCFDDGGVMKEVMGMLLGWQARNIELVLCWQSGCLFDKNPAMWKGRSKFEERAVGVLSQSFLAA